MVKNLPAVQEMVQFDPWVRKIPWRRAWQPTLVFLPGESHGQRSPVGYGPWGHNELDMTERISGINLEQGLLPIITISPWAIR